MVFSNIYLKDPEHVTFEPKDGRMSMVSFVGTDVSRIQFGEHIRFDDEEDTKFKINEERSLEIQLGVESFVERLKKQLKKQLVYKWNPWALAKSEPVVLKDTPLGAELGVYRNLRENYEFRMRYDEAGEFFIREMEMKRKYKVKRTGANMYTYSLKPWIVRNLSLTGLYYNLSEYGQSVLRPTLFGIGIIALSSFLWFTQPDHSLDFSVSEILFSQENLTIPHLQDSFERSILNFIPLLPSKEGIQLGMMDYLFKIIGGAVTFGLIIIALRRRFERKFRH
jgi:hypothetical protein